ncbi:MAG TPA: hypothetical protein VGD17_12890 [Chitinophagaceae bacterium]
MKQIAIIILLVCFLVLHKAFNYGLYLFGLNIILYIAVWISVLSLLYYLVFRISKDRVKAVIATTMNGIFLLTFGDIQDFIQETIPFRYAYATWVLLPLFITALILYLRLGRSRKNTGDRILNFLLILLVTVNVFEVLNYIFAQSPDRETVGNKKPAYAIPQSPSQKDSLPDIYYIIFDAYTSDSCLKKYWRLNNASLADYLRKSGFYVSGNARSVYDFTPLSVYSTFQMDYLKLSATELKPDFRNFNRMRRRFSENNLFSALNSYGYDIRSYSVLSDSINLNRFYPFTPDEPLHWLRRQTVERVWLNPWLLNKFKNVFRKDELVPASVSQAILNLDRYNTQALEEIAEDKKGNAPRFVFAHFFIPHAPYIYDSSGTLLPPNEVVNNASDSLNYIDQVLYSNQLISTITKDLLKTYSNKVIIFQGDHGFREYGKQIDPMARLGILNAVYFPDSNYRQLTDTFLSVNTFRVVLNNYFRQELKILP